MHTCKIHGISVEFNSGYINIVLKWDSIVYIYMHLFVDIILISQLLISTITELESHWILIMNTCIEKQSETYYNMWRK